MNYIENCQHLGIDIVDTQHNELLDRANALIKILEKNSSKEEIIKKYNAFILAVEAHFSTEEKMFQEFEYTERDRHISMHNFFIDSLKEPRNNFDNYDIELSTHIIDFLNNWAKNHISSFDLTFANEYKAYKKM